MRPLSSTVKTAVIFYPIYAGLILMVTFWSPVKQVSTADVQKNREILTSANSIDFILKEQQFKTSWQQILKKAGYPQDLYKLQVETLLEKRYGAVKIKWVRSESTMVLPASTGETQLIRLGSEWKELTRSSGFSLTSAKWGYSEKFIWVRLANSAHLNLSNQEFSLPIEQVTIIQPVSGFNGLMPILPPQLTMEDNPIWVPDLIKKIPPAKDQNSIKPKAILKKARVALIIDDLGFVTGPADEVLKIEAPLTWAILPEAPFSKKYTEAAKEHGFEIILHLPLEPLQKTENPGPGVIKRDWSEQEITDQLNKNLAELPEAVGINNHMGSAGTIDDRLMDILMKEIKQRQLFFVDSYTNAHSVAEKYARLYKIPFAKRKVFIDNEETLISKKKALRMLIKFALRDGVAIGIAHVREGTAQAILEMLPEFEKAGVEIVPVSELVE